MRTIRSGSLSTRSVCRVIAAVSMAVGGAVAPVNALSMASDGPVTTLAASAGEEASPESVHEALVGNVLSDADVEQVPALAGTLDAKDPSVDSVTLQASGYAIVCKVTAHNPHISHGKLKEKKVQVIFKSTVLCTGTGSYPPFVVLRHRGALMYDKAKSSGDASDGVVFVPARTSDVTNPVVKIGKQYTFHTPKAPEEGATGTGHYRGSATVQLVSPTGSTVGSHVSATVFCKPATLTSRCS